MLVHQSGSLGARVHARNAWMHRAADAAEALDLCLDPAVSAHANIRAVLALALQGLLRGSELNVDEGKAVNPKRHL